MNRTNDPRTIVLPAEERELFRLAMRRNSPGHLACLDLALAFVAFATAGLPSSKTAAKCSIRYPPSQGRVSSNMV
jgi:hypothetical protein